MIRDPVQWHVAEHAMHQSFDDEAVVLDLAGGAYFRLNRTAARAWERLKSGATVDQLADALAREFEVERAVLRADMEALVLDLSSRGLVREGP